MLQIQNHNKTAEVLQQNYIFTIIVATHNFRNKSHSTEHTSNSEISKIEPNFLSMASYHPLHVSSLQVRTDTLTTGPMYSHVLCEKVRELEVKMENSVAKLESDAQEFRWEK